MPPKDAKKAPKAAAAADKGTAEPRDDASGAQRSSASAGAPAVRPAPAPADGLFGLGRGITNLLFHSLLMVAVPFSIFFGSYYGYFNPIYAATFGLPEERNKAIPAAILAVLSVQFVIVSFVVQAFKEDQEPPKKKSE